MFDAVRQLCFKVDLFRPDDPIGFLHDLPFDRARDLLAVENEIARSYRFVPARTKKLTCRLIEEPGEFPNGVRSATTPEFLAFVSQYPELAHAVDTVAFEDFFIVGTRHYNLCTRRAEKDCARATLGLRPIDDNDLPYDVWSLVVEK